MPEIRHFTVDQFFAHPDAAGLLAEYASEAAIAGLPAPQPARETYEAVERSGALCVLVATEGEQMLGFLALVVSPNPHYGILLGVTESYFVSKQYRALGAGLHLLHAAERVAQEVGAKGLLVSAPSEGRLVQVLERNKAYRETNRVFFRGFA